MNEISSLQNNTGLCSSVLKEENKEEAYEEGESMRRLQLADGGAACGASESKKVGKQREQGGGQAKM